MLDRTRRFARETGTLRSEGALRRPLGFAAYAYGRLERARGRRGRAAGALRLALRADPNSVTYAGEAGVELARSGDSDAAEVILARLLETAEEIEAAEAGEQQADGEGAALADARAHAALVCEALGDLRGTRELAAAAIEAAPGEWPRRAAVAVALERAGEPTGALEQAYLAGESRQQRRLEGLLRATNPDWMPELPRTPLGTAPKQALCLLESSLPHTPSGYAYRSRAVMRAFRDAGVEPVAATRLGFPANRGIGDWSEVESVEGVVHHRFGPRAGRRAEPLDTQLQDNAELLLGLAERIPPSLLVAASPHPNGLLGLALRDALGVPLVYDVRGFPEMSLATRFGGAGSELYRRRRAAETRCALQADAVITLSETMRAELLARGVDRDSVSVVPHSVDTDLLTPREPPVDLARSYGLEGRFVIGCVTSLNEYEGMDVLLRALAEARAEHPDLAALIVGDGPARGSLQRLAAELGIADAVVFSGPVAHESVPDHLALLDLFALPRHDLEVCRAVTPLKPFEALAMGVPLVVSDLAALTEVARDSGAARVVPAGDHSALARTVLELASDRVARVELGTRAVAYARDRHSPATVAERLRAVLASLPAHRPATQASEGRWRA